MAWPVVLWGPEGEQFNTYSGQRWPLGTQMIMQDGRKFRFCLKSAAAAVAGNVQQAGANTANHVGQTSDVARAIGARLASFTSGATLGAVNDYREGHLGVNDVGGPGYLYLIESHAAWASSAVATFNFAPGHSIQVALTSSSILSAIRNTFQAVIIFPTAATREVAGVAVKPIAASYYGWLATYGPAMALTEGTVVVGNKVMNSLTTAGAVAPQAATYAVSSHNEVGRVMRVAATTLYSHVFLTMDG